MFKMRILKDYEFSVLLSDIEEMGEYFIPSRESVPEKGQIIAFVTGKLARVASFKVIRQLTPLDSSSHRIQVALINHYPYGLRLPKKKLLDSKDAADWMILIHDAFRVTARRMNIPRQICHQEGARSKFLYRNDDIWEAAVSIRTPEHRLNRINERVSCPVDPALRTFTHHRSDASSPFLLASKNSGCASSQLNRV